MGNKVLLAVEVKDFEFARTPFELSNEIEKLLQGPDSAVHHHEERLTFLRSNLERVVAELNLPGAAREWEVHGQIVTSSDLVAAHFPVVEAPGKRPPIMSFEALVAGDPRYLTGRRRAGQSTRADRQKKRKRRHR